jgi:putative membrane protein insertion efficiency factor
MSARGAVVGILRFYQRFVSPLLPAACRYQPTCSEYAMQAVRRHGVLRGSRMALWRLLRCQPFSKGGYDPVPPERELHEPHCT